MRPFREIGAATALALATTAVPGLTGQTMAAQPAEPRVIKEIADIGHTGGELKTLIGRARDTRLLQVYGNARLVGYDMDLRLVPDLLGDFQVEEGRIFTFRLRQGHEWSDGQPFTTDDFRFWWEDVAHNPKLMPSGPPIQMLVDGEPPKVEIVDKATIRFSWSQPNPFFLPALAGPDAVYIYLPAHYLKPFHEKYADPAALEQAIKQTESRDWAQLFGRKERMKEFDNPDMPTLAPWKIATKTPADRFIAERNPNFHRVDANGQALPYIERIIMDVVDNKLIPIKTGAGETDLQARGLFFKDYTFLKESEGRSGLKTLLWREARGAHLALYPNLNASDPVWQKLFRDLRFRKALALAVDREAVNQYLYFGLATPANNTITPDSPLYTDEVGTACLGFDVEAANHLLDQIGLTAGPDGMRKLPDGRPLELVVETAGEDSEQADVLELVRDSYAKIGLKLHTKPSDRDVLRNRIFSGDALMTIWYGWDNGVPTADTPPNNFAPVSQFDQPMWPKWGQFYETKGASGEKPALPEAAQLMELYKNWGVSTDTSEREKIWHEMLRIFSSQCYTISVVGNVMQPIAVRQSLQNLPEEAIYNWEPQSQFGIYLPDTWWLKQP
jgi:peptide/nickel transport system substrate-binding protein